MNRQSSPGFNPRLAPLQAVPRTALACLLALAGILGWAVEARGQDSATDRAALVALYNATGGANWENNTNWLSNEPLSEWYGVYVQIGRVTRLQLRHNQLTGSIPPNWATSPAFGGWFSTTTN